ncbi:hypothetical protein CR513_09216, partial [Mucuna pruriens]
VGLVVVLGHGIPLSKFCTYLLFPFSLCIHISFLFTSMLILLPPTSFFIQNSCFPSEVKRVALDTSHLVLWYDILPLLHFLCSCTLWSLFWVHICDSGCLVRLKWILVCLLGNQAWNKRGYVNLKETT